MLPIFAAAPFAASLLNGLFHAVHHPQPPQTAQSQADFSKYLSTEMKEQKEAQPMDQMGSIQSLISLQKSMGPLQPEVQVALAQQLLQKNVQIQDSAGNNLTGIVTNAHWNKGQMNLTIGNRDYPLTSLQAVLYGTSNSH